MNNSAPKFYNYLRNRYKGIPLVSGLVTELKSREKLSRAEIQQYQLDRINELVSQARVSTNFYRASFSGVKKSFDSLGQFEQISPIVTKEHIRVNYSDLINVEEGNRFSHATSGSTGTPIVTEISSLAQAYRLASIERFYSWWGISPQDSSVLIWGIRKTLNNSGVINRVKNKLKNRLDINVFDLNEETILKYFDEIEKFQPVYIRGYKSALYSLADLMKKNDLSFSNERLKLVIVTSEVLHENERAFIEQSLNCKVANEYGAGECGLYAAECPEGSMHINEQALYIHTDEEDNALVTELYNTGMPLINYKNNDRILISSEPCSCGRSSRIIKKIQGRVNDFIDLPNEEKKSSHLFNHLVKELNDKGFNGAFRFFKITQTQNEFILEVVPGDMYSDRAATYYIKRMKEEIGNQIDVTLKLVDEIERDKSGKLRYFKKNK